MRLTTQRQVILDMVRHTTVHPTTDDIYRLVRERMPRISLGTVYRNLELLAARGLIKKVENTGSQRRYDGNLDFHYHLRCVSCGLVIDAPLEPVPDLGSGLSEATDFEVFGYQLDFLGLCPACQKQTNQTNRLKEDYDAKSEGDENRKEPADRFRG